ncbi:MAG: hypothetical protein J6Y37_17790 [Paludibacteraceae bacterium]|nr:hypothetical protein [Paludibacteraceae bacterium]
MKKFITLFAIVAMLAMINSCGTSKKAVASQDYTVEEVELYGYGVGQSTNENTARGIAMTAALGDLSIKLESTVNAVRSNYEKQNGEYNKALYESLVDVVSSNRLTGITYKGDRKPASRRGGEFEYRIEAHVSQVLLRKNVDAILDQMDASAEERNAYRREMFGE